MSKSKKRYFKLPGSRRQRRKARSALIMAQNSDAEFSVWGGRDRHKVTRTGIFSFKCDCEKNAQEKKVCSHIIKVKMELGVFPKVQLEYE